VGPPPVLVRERETGEEEEEVEEDMVVVQVTGKDGAVLEGVEAKLVARGVLVMVIALFPTLIGS